MGKVSNPSKMEINSTSERSGNDGEGSRLAERREGGTTKHQSKAYEDRKREDTAKSKHLPNDLKGNHEPNKPPTCIIFSPTKNNNSSPS